MPLSLSKASQFVKIVSLLKPLLSWYQPSYVCGPPTSLPLKFHDFLRLALDLNDKEIKQAWSDLGNDAWAQEMPAVEELSARTKYMAVFLQHGLSRDIGVFSLEPLSRTCIDSACAQQLCADPSQLRDKELVEPLTVKITVYTKEFGSVPRFSTSRYCRHCHTRYHPNYYVHSDATLQTYYRDNLRYLQISGHCYVDINLCELFSIMMVTSCVPPPHQITL
ncbi:hypothetical protein DFH08DRAFT_954764 [Mycena albidolilacea]|uniref:CxC5 like cysteine cluster associated with KDZ domain-containing protein n=1 Tax=Mycena albidolilacea TaxID=1033008 RepID=A0AAD7ACL2_9AGAR|nr:hypothetical protein DFH08DRAFT_954764 [Mycena albidolilacea]